MTHKIAVIGGDGIGPEVTTEALKVIRAAGVTLNTTDFDLGGARYLKDGEILSDSTLDELRIFVSQWDTRARVSADGHLYTCLFATEGLALKPHLRPTVDRHLSLGCVRVVRVGCSGMAASGDCA